MKNFKDNIVSNLETYKAVVKSLYDNPEIGLQEYESSKLLAKTIKDLGFEITYPFILDTGFMGKYISSKKGPKVAFLCEYDALPGIGHGCAHNLIGVMSIAAANALKTVIDDIGGEIYIFGTPAEENFGGKIDFTNAGVFNDMDLALMLHPGTSNRVGSRTVALMPIKYEFFGRSSHGCSPQDGINALDAAVLTYNGINELRKNMLPNTFIHGIIRDGGNAANVIPDYASMEFYFRNPKMTYAKELVNKSIEVAEEACKSIGAVLKTSTYETPYDDKLINYTLCNKLKEIYQSLNLEDILDVNEIPCGSSDIGSVSYVCPTLEGSIKIANKDVLGHSKEMAAATISEAGTQAIINGGIALAQIAYEYITNKEFEEEVNQEFKESNK